MMNTSEIRKRLPRSTNVFSGSVMPIKRSLRLIDMKRAEAKNKVV